jgi:flagellar protein FlaJ
MAHNNKKIAIEMGFLITGAAIIFFNFFFISDKYPIFSPFLNVLGGLVGIVPPFLMFYSGYKINKEMEEQFILFINDITEAIDSGMTLPMALKHSTKRDYRSLTKHVKDVHNRVDWGMPFEKALIMFADNVKSTPIKRSVSTIIETYKIGGKLSDTLKAIGKSLIELNKIKQERSVSVQSQIVTSYMIFFVFIFILIILQTFLIPPLSETNTDAFGSETSRAAVPKELFTQTFVNFIIVQGFFAGLATGKMAEGSAISGLKHSILLIVIGYTAFSLFGHLQIKIF